MPATKPQPPADESETIIEFAVREQLTKEQIADLLGSLGGQRQGSRAELGERLLGTRGLKPRDVIAKLSVNDLRVIVRRFEIPESKPGGPLGFATSFFEDERSTLAKRVEAATDRQRPPKVRPSAPVPAQSEAERPVGTRTGAAQPTAAEPGTSVAPAVTPLPTPASKTIPSQAPTPAGSPVGLPVFQETRDFVGSYKFAYQWDSEDLYEAELLGALRGRFGQNNAVRQQGESGRVYDIVVRNSARVEVKLPKQKAELDRMIGQVRRYLSQHPGGVIVVIVGFMMKNQQEIHNSQEELESAGAVVFVK